VGGGGRSWTEESLPGTCVAQREEPVSRDIVAVGTPTPTATEACTGPGQEVID
jgi:hypothetical protein